MSRKEQISRSERKDSAVETLECGTSRAEDEHYARIAVDDYEHAYTPPKQKHGHDSIESLRDLLAADVLTDGRGGVYTTFASPFAAPKGSSNYYSGSGQSASLQLPLVYCDQTASNRPVRSIERYMEKICLPLYGNTHTNTSITGSQSTAFVAEARQIVAEETNAKITGKASLDVVLFAGNGTTFAVELLIDCLGLKDAARIDGYDRRPVVFIGPYEHHSNIVPWRETGCEIVMVPECPTAHSVDIAALERLLQKPEYEKRMKMGTFTAASNVTGKICDVDRIAAMLHKHGALAFIDYATAAPYLKIDMNPTPSLSGMSPALVAKDAIFLSPHKMLGGVGTPGVLIVKKQLVSQVNAPSRSGGGTVFYVTNTHHRFVSNRIERYEGGTPNIAGIMRVGLTFLLKRKVEQNYKLLIDQMAARETAVLPSTMIPRSLEDFDCLTHQKVAAYLNDHAPNLVLLGVDEGCRNLPIFSFLIRCGKRFLHYNYVCAVLNDVFGIQSRGGCQCAGPYSQRLLGLTSVTPEGEVPNKCNEEIESALYRFKEWAELLRPGYTRLSLPFKGLRQEEVDYVMKALVWVARNGWALMCQYRCNHRTGEWRHSNRQGKPLGRDERKWLSHYDFSVARDGQFCALSDYASQNVTLEETLANADKILAAAKADQRSVAEAVKMADADFVLDKDEDSRLEELRWYVYPKECAALLAAGLSKPIDEGTEISGALVPVHSANGQAAELNCLEAHCKNRSSHRKRKSSSDEESYDASADLNLVNAPASLLFRDGEHSGEATYTEIRDGVDDGELSDLCEICDGETGDFVSFHSFARIFNKRMKPDTNQPDEELKTSCTKQPLDTSAVQEKKAPRFSSAWGQSQHVAPNNTGQPTFEQAFSSASTNADVSSGTCPLPPSSGSGKKRYRHVKPPPKLMRMATQAIMQWEMLKDGDKLLLGLSGGKDSLSLLHCLLELQRKLPIKFELEVCTIDPMTPSFDPSPLIPYVESLGLKYHYVRDDIVSRAEKSGKNGKLVSSLCAYCARMKRGNLYSCARRNHCNKLVLAQHLDDCAESLMMSMMHNGFLRTMKANYKIDEGDISVIRPLVYCRESLMTDFAKSRGLPVINENCPACFEEPKERARIKKLLSREETLYPNFYDNIRRSLLPLMHDDMSSILRSYTEDVVARSRKKPYRGKNAADGTASPAAAAADVSTSGSTTTDNLRNSADAKMSKSEKQVSKCIDDATDEELILELARRKAEKYRLNTKSKPKENGFVADIPDQTSQVCTLNGGNGTIPCRELME